MVRLRGQMLGVRFRVRGQGFGVRVRVIGVRDDHVSDLDALLLELVVQHAAEVLGDVSTLGHRLV